jgi:hypothetical protein
VVLMAADPLEQVLRLVAEGRLTADEAGPILAALDDRAGGTPGAEGSARAQSGATSLLLEVREGGRQVVNLRLPIAVGRLALDRVPGLSGDQVERVREALAGGMRGPILQVEDGDNGVRIVLE